MIVSDLKPVLIIGGAGVVGSQAARILRTLYPDLRIAIGGRDIARAEAAALSLGNAEAVVVDLDRPDLGLSVSAQFSAVAIFLKDDGLNSLRYAQSHRIGYIDISTAITEIGQAVSLFVQRPDAAPILMASNWLAGTATLPAIHFAKSYASIDEIALGFVLDEQDMGGPEAYVSYERLMRAAPNPLSLADGKWGWDSAEKAARTLTGIDGTIYDAHGVGVVDVLSIANATEARSIRVDLAVGETASRRNGDHFTTDIIVEIKGKLPGGSQTSERWEIVHPAGQAPLTGLGVAIGIESLLGIGGAAAAAPGFYLPEALIDPAYMIEKMKEFGASITRR